MYYLYCGKFIPPCFAVFNSIPSFLPEPVRRFHQNYDAMLTVCMQCRTPVLEKASKAVWELILDNGGLGKEITETVEKVFCRLSGIDMMPPPPSGAGAHREKDDMSFDEKFVKSKEVDAFEPSSSRKRPFSDVNRKGAGALPNGSATDQHDESEDSDQKI